MKNLIIAALIFSALLITTATLAKASTKVMWGKTKLRKGQIDKVTVLCTTQLYQKDHEGILRHSHWPIGGEEFRVYSFSGHDGGYYEGGGSLYIKKSTVLKYETPSKFKIALLKNNTVDEKSSLPKTKNERLPVAEDMSNAPISNGQTSPISNEFTDK
ncbi:hypothetical protein H9650_05245 [Psychrobacillus sp. Sa2BUA9]|uniref:Secreted protein n=1 Tax=Psychrobacillus faecigallinarum TaxID=2762235 RepID=A0ABR8R6V8_9BACI|nr:hypothetical protein [Psychrobacillus faecigallinarum]MBD7943518.1 hypothetical protein [Psychrobacillus faecigallinarum]